MPATTAVAAAIFLATLHPGPASAAAASAQAWAMADQIAAAAGAGDLFDNVTNGQTPMLRHKASGLVCRFTAEPGDEVAINPGLPRGDDVSCSWTERGAVVRLFATRLGSRVTLDDALALYSREIVDTNRGAERLFWDDAADTLPERQSARFQLRPGAGAPLFSRLSVAIVGEWVIEERLTGPLARSRELDLLGEQIMVRALDEMKR